MQSLQKSLNEIATFVDVQNDSVTKQNYEWEQVIDDPPPELSKAIDDG